MRPTLVDPARRLPLLAPWYRLVQEPDRLLLEHGGSVVTFEGKAAGLLLPRLLPLLDGTRSVEQVVAELGIAAERPVRQAVALLEEHGLLLEGDGTPTGHVDEAAAYVAAAVAGAPAPTSAARRLAETRTAVIGRSRVADELARLLGTSGVSRIERGDAIPGGTGLDLLLAAPDRTETELLREVNAAALDAQCPWLQIVPHDGRVVVVGPLVLPGRSACHECYRLRRAAGSDYEVDFELIEAVPGRGADPPALVAVTAGIASLIALRWLASSDPTLPGRISTVHTRGPLKVRDHHVLRVPRCPACGTGLQALPSPWFKEAALDG